VRVLLIVICGLCIAIPTQAMARPKTKIAVAPLDGDPGNKVALAVVDALAGKAYEVVGPKLTGREMTRLGLDTLDGKATRKLASKLGVVAIIDGKVSKAGKKRSLHLEVHRRGKPVDGFTVEFKSASSSGFRKGIHGEIGKKLDGAGEDPAEDDEPRRPFADEDRKRDDEERTRKADEDRKRDDDARRQAESDRKRDDDGRRQAESDRKRDFDRPRRVSASDDDDRARRPTASDRKRGDDDAPRKSSEGRKGRVAAADDDDRTTRRRRSRVKDDAAPLIAARVGAGGSVAQRQLSWDLRGGLTGTQIPPRVRTTAGAGRVDGEVYPFALADPSSSLAALGLAAAYDRTFGLSIKVPNQTVSAPIDQSHFSIGARYRFAIGDASSLALGLDYASRKYVAERGGLMGAVLDAPDVAYSAVSPGAWLRVPVASSVTVFGGADGLLIFEAGAIQKTTSYGPATVYGLEATGGVDIALTKQIAVRIGLEYSQIMFTFTPKGATMANNRDNNPTSQDVMGATDRSIGGAVTLGFVY
jgi:hypothetical protein